MDDVQRSDVQLSDTEIDRINEASDRAHRRSDELRSRLAGSAGTPDTGTGEYIAGALARDRGVQVEAELARAAKAGDAAAIDELVQRSMPLVVGAARRHAVGGLELADLIQEGTAALLRALERYDPDRGVPFSAYARRRVHRALDDLLREFVRPARLSRKDLRELSRLRSERDRLYARTGREPTVEELAELVGIDPRRARELLWLDAPPRSLYDPVVLDEEDALGRHPVEPLEDLLPDPWSTDYDELVDRVASEQLRGLLSRLTAREQEIVTAHYGLDGRRPEGLDDIAERLGMSVYRVRRLERQALAKLRQQAVAAAAEQGLEPEGSRRESSGPESEHDEAAEPHGSGLGSAGPGSEHDRADREADRKGTDHGGEAEPAGIRPRDEPGRGRQGGDRRARRLE